MRFGEYLRMWCENHAAEPQPTKVQTQENPSFFWSHWATNASAFSSKNPKGSEWCGPTIASESQRQTRIRVRFGHLNPSQLVISHSAQTQALRCCQRSTHHARKAQTQPQTWQTHSQREASGSQKQMERLAYINTFFVVRHINHAGLSPEPAVDFLGTLDSQCRRNSTTGKAARIHHSLNTAALRVWLSTFAEDLACRQVKYPPGQHENFTTLYFLVSRIQNITPMAWGKGQTKVQRSISKWHSTRPQVGRRQQKCARSHKIHWLARTIPKCLWFTRKWRGGQPANFCTVRKWPGIIEFAGFLQKELETEQSRSTALVFLLFAKDSTFEVCSWAGFEFVITPAILCAHWELDSPN